MVRLALTLTALAQAATVLAWTWPSPQLERLDALRYDQVPPPGAISNDITNQANPCEKNDAARSLVTGSELTNSADWVRTVCPYFLSRRVIWCANVQIRHSMTCRRTMPRQAQVDSMLRSDSPRNLLDLRYSSDVVISSLSLN
jgi:hypothetical protein